MSPPRRPATKKTPKPTTATTAAAAPALGVVKRSRDAAARLVASRVEDLGAIAEAGRKSYAGIDTVIKRHRDMLREALGELQSVAKVMRIAGPRESISRLDELGSGALHLTLNNIRELATLAAATQNEALKLLERRLKTDLDELKRLQLRKPARRQAKR